ncbi:MAG: nickel pincer cofactor biosynthesis protein LarC [Acidobacteriota bacterium]
MTNVLYFDTCNGASGDMILGALIDLGLPLSHLKAQLEKLSLPSFGLAVDRIERQGLVATHFRVVVKPAKVSGAPAGQHGKKGESAPVSHDPEDGFHSPPGHQEHRRSRNFQQIRGLIESSGLDAWVKEASVRIFRRLGEAEAKVHGCPLNEVHFHEVGAIDSIVDIVGACIGFRYFEVEGFYTGPLALGGGTVRFSHGHWPVPTPATAELVRGFPVILGRVRAELTTPTGAAIITTLAREDTFLPLCEPSEWGLGAGNRELEEIPNVLRLMLGRAESQQQPNAEAGIKEEEVLLLEASIDNMDAELLGHFLERALGEGALDAYYTALHMKKNRPGVLLSLLCRREDHSRMMKLVFQETRTLGLRWTPWRRWTLDREIRRVETEWGPVDVKIGRFQGLIVHAWPEYEDLKKVAREQKLPLKWVRQRVIEQLGNLAHE